ncbi:hypothetical protein DYB28_016025 [Aphanomyces astaci]|uniref:Uncharacterized protein n=1 Tax=Aphanomyces astaci TaxID=112090 RepID=A0A9X8H1Q4_APHAT|nr:hypothetical protein DYB28_012142 [Aphanomyces astaci]RLO07143.1 hypothetical protein DYB28_013369 [Aphanomyces astaci]RLO13016.1 hypothetical protein DYB28_012135 [Aphanomyces astaci]RLO13770.1 hypothetical protein DYB28_016025 [Aphanomyces astaci]
MTVANIAPCSDVPLPSLHPAIAPSYPRTILSPRHRFPATSYPRNILSPQHLVPATSCPRNILSANHIVSAQHHVREPHRVPAPQ